MTRPGRRRVLAALAACGAAIFVAMTLLPNVGLLDRDQVGDTPSYRRAGDSVLAGRVPYRDFYLEYPPAALPVFAAPAIGDATGYATRFKVLACALGALIVALVVATLGAAGATLRRTALAAAFVAFAPAALGPVVLVNYDVWPALLTLAALAALVRGRGRLAMAGLGMATAAKVYPLVLAPVALVYVRARAGTRAALVAAAVFVAVVAAIVLPFFALAPGGIGFSASVFARRGLQIESLGSSVLLAAHRLGVYTPTVDSAYNSQNLAGELPRAVSIATTVMLALALLAVWTVFARNPVTRERLFLAAAAAVAATVALGKILSPQFLVWLLPLVPLVAGRRGAFAAGVLGVALVLTQLWFPSHYGSLVALGPVSWLVLVRDIVLVGLLVALALGLRARHETARS